MARTRLFLLLIGSLAFAGRITGQIPSTPPPSQGSSSVRVCARCVQAHMAFLASDALRGRGSGTPDELLAATYVASQLEQYGVQPAGDAGTYIQRVTLLRRQLKAPPRLSFIKSPKAASATTWIHGKEIRVLQLSAPGFSGPLQKVDLDKEKEPAVKIASVVLLTGDNQARIRQAVFDVLSQGAAAVLVPESPRSRALWNDAKLPELPVQFEDGAESAMGPHFNVVAISKSLIPVLSNLPNGITIRLLAPAAPPQKSYTWNALGRIPGSDPSLANGAILLSAHLDHLGIGPAVNGDSIYNGADDDASGTTAVLELARVLGASSQPRRTVIFALFGSEESGGLGSTYFREHPPLPLKDIAANLEFEMIARPDPAVPQDTLWLTGWERSNLGPELASHGAHLVGDPHPDQGFFRRSDNYVLAKEGVVAQTVSSFGLHHDYHRPSDDLSHVDFNHMDAAIDSLLGPVMWLVNSGFTPRWNQGAQP